MMSILTQLVLPELEKQLILQAPEIIEYLLSNTEAIISHLVEHIGKQIQGVNHGKEVHTKSD